MKKWLKENWEIILFFLAIVGGVVSAIIFGINLYNEQIAEPVPTVSESTATSSQYPISLVITNIDENTDLVLLVDCNGNLWSFRGKEDYAVGDIVAAIMDDKGTPEITDDEIIQHRYCGYIREP